MQHLSHPGEAPRAAQARMSYSGRLLTERQFEDVMAVTGIIERRIHETGAFRECLNDFSNALARTERFDAVKADTIIRDLFRITAGMSMNEMRKGLMEREDKLLAAEGGPPESERRKAYQAAIEAGKAVAQGDKITFYRALSAEAAQLAAGLGITHAGARKFIRQSFGEIEGRSLREWGGALDEKYYRPQIEAEKAARAQEKKQSPARTHARARRPGYG